MMYSGANKSEQLFISKLEYGSEIRLSQYFIQQEGEVNTAKILAENKMDTILYA